MLRGGDRRLGTTRKPRPESAPKRASPRTPRARTLFPSTFVLNGQPQPCADKDAWFESNCHRRRLTNGDFGRQHRMARRCAGGRRRVRQRRRARCQTSRRRRRDPQLPPACELVASVHTPAVTVHQRESASEMGLLVRAWITPHLNLTLCLQAKPACDRFPQQHAIAGRDPKQLSHPPDEVRLELAHHAISHGDFP
jgi:hypothetical protein